MPARFQNKILYKCLLGERSPDGTAFFTGPFSGQYGYGDYSKYLPRNGKPGRWTKEESWADVCRRGYHAWLGKRAVDANGHNGNFVFTVELKGIVHDDDPNKENKVAGRRMRLLKFVGVIENGELVRLKRMPRSK